MVAEQQRQTTSRRNLSKHDHFDEVSPEVGVLDESAFTDLHETEPDEALSMLSDLTAATDQRLRELARRLAGRLVLELGRTGPLETRGVGRLRSVRFDGSPSDLDLEASLEAIQQAQATGEAVNVDDLYLSRWARPATAICLLVDRSGSMGGERLATAAVAVAACAWRAPDDHSVVAFSDKAIVVKSQEVSRPPDKVVDDVLSLRGHGPTDLALALTTAFDQLARSKAKRRLVVLLSDCRPTAGSDPILTAARLDELCIIAPSSDAEDAQEFATTVGARIGLLSGPSAIPSVLTELLNPS